MTDLRNYAAAVARKYGVPASGFVQQIAQESGFNPSARSPAGAIGIAQFMPGTARGLGINPRNPTQSLDAAARHMATLHKNLGSWDLALAAYNAGAGAVQRYKGVPPYRETQNYVAKLGPYFRAGNQSGAGLSPPLASSQTGRTLQNAAGTFDIAAILRLMQRNRQSVLAGRGVVPGFQQALLGQVRRGIARGQKFGPDAVLPQTVPGPSGPASGLTMGGGPSAHASRALGNWQSDMAYDLMGRAGQAVYSPVAGRVIKVSGQRGGRPGFAGYGVTVRTGQGDLFFKHLGMTPLRVGSVIRPGSLIGALDPSTAGGPHLHLGGTNRAQLDRLSQLYTRAGR